MKKIINKIENPYSCLRVGFFEIIRLRNTTATLSPFWYIYGLNEIFLEEVYEFIYIKEAWNNQPKPYVNARNSCYDLQLNIFGYRL
ncbi:MAG: hypothetical protein LBE91_21235 [Tannerella sp.]|jgi:hypothetical protein|nr:hypothetical protein [Tannerella sp.]